MSLRFQKLVNSMDDIMGRQPTETELSHFKGALLAYVNETVDKLTNNDGTKWTHENKQKVMEAISLPMASMLANIEARANGVLNNSTVHKVKVDIDNLVNQRVNLSRWEQEVDKLKAIISANRDIGFANYVNAVDSKLKNNMLVRNIQRSKKLTAELHALKGHVNDIKKSMVAILKK